METEEEEDLDATELDPPFPYRIRPLDWSWVGEPTPSPALEATGAEGE